MGGLKSVGLEAAERVVEGGRDGGVLRQGLRDGDGLVVLVAVVAQVRVGGGVAQLPAQLFNTAVTTSPPHTSQLNIEGFHL